MGHSISYLCDTREGCISCQRNGDHKIEIGAKRTNESLNETVGENRGEGGRNGTQFW